MTINLSDNNPRVSYAVAEGVTQTSFTVSFEFFDNDDLNVYVDGTLKTITTHYTVSGGSGSTGTVTMSVTGATGGSTVVITRDIDLDRTTDFPSSGPFNIGSLNTELDRMIAITADLEDLASRGVKLADFDTAATLTLPLAADRVNKVLAFNSAGDTLVSQELGVWKGDWAASTAYVERDLVRDSSDGSIYIVTSAHTSSGSTPLDTNTNSSKYSVIFDIGAMIAGTVTMTGNLSVQGNTTLGNAATDTVTITADVASNILPSADNTYDLGGTGAEWKDVYIDGVAYVDSIAMPTTTVTDILDEDTMSSNSATALATQQSIKTYVDSQIGSNNELSEILGNGNTTGGNNIQLTTTDELQFRDTALKISSSADGQLDIDADTEVEVTSATIDLNVSSELKITRGIVKVMDFSGTSGDVQFYDDSNNAKLRWDASADVLTFEDNVQAYFGGGSAPHLRINHDGTDSFIKNEGTGKLYISSASDDIQLRKGTSEVMAKFTPDGASELYYDNSKKIETTSTGIDVTGTVTADGLTVDKTDTATYSSTAVDDTLVITRKNSSGTNNQVVGIEFDVTQASGVTTGIAGISAVQPTNASSADLVFQTRNAGTIGERMRIDSGGDISFYEDTGTTAKLFWDASAESLGIGTTSPSHTISLESPYPYISFNETDQTPDQKWVIGGASGNFIIYDDTDAATRLAVDGDGNIGIGTTSPERPLHISANPPIILLEDTGGGTDDKRGQINVDTGLFQISARNDDNSNRTDILTADLGTGYVGLGTTSPSGLFHAKDSSSSFMFKDVSGNAKIFLDGSNGDFAGGDYMEIEVDSSPNLMFKQAGTERMRIDSSGNVGIGTTSPQAQVHLQGSGSSSGRLRLNNTNTANYSVLEFRGDSQSFDVGLGNSAATATLQNKFYIYDATNTTTRLVLDSSGNVGIGTTSPSSTLEVSKSDQTNGTTLTITNAFSGGSWAVNDVIGTIDFKTDDASTTQLVRGRIQSITDDVTGTNWSYGTALAFSTALNNTLSEAMRIDRGGRLLLGTTDVGVGGADEFTIATSSDTGISIRSGTSSTGNIYFADGTSGNAQYRGYVLYNHSSDYLAFGTSASEKARIDSSGNLLVGKTVTTFGTEGIAAFNSADSGGSRINITNDGGTPLNLNRLTSDGEIAGFYKDGTQVGVIGVNADRPYIGSSLASTDANIKFTDVQILPCDATGANTDGTDDIGSSSARFDDIYATNGTIQTSDRNEKQDIAELTDAEQRVAVAAKGLLRKFRWKDAVAEKGDEARTHFGIIAQDLQAAFAAEGLDASDYAMFISTTWTDEETDEERTRMGVRYSELLAFIIAAI